jgi:hypothetical protein
MPFFFAALRWAHLTLLFAVSVSDADMSQMQCDIKKETAHLH